MEVDVGFRALIRKPHRETPTPDFISL